MNRVYRSALSIIIIIIFSCGSQLYGMRALTRSFARVSMRPTQAFARRTLHRAPMFPRAQESYVSKPSATILEVRPQAIFFTEDSDSDGQVIIDAQFNIVDHTLERNNGDYFFDIIIHNGLSYEGEVKAFLLYIQDLHHNNLHLYKYYMNRVYGLVTTRLSGQEYVNPMLLASVILSDASFFKNIMHIISGNVCRITSENVFASYKTLEMLLTVTPDSETKELHCKNWVCTVPDHEVSYLMGSYFKSIPKNIKLSHQEILLQLIYGATFLVKGLQEKARLRTDEIETITSDLKKYEEAYDKLLPAHS